MFREERVAFNFSAADAVFEARRCVASDFPLEIRIHGCFCVKKFLKTALCSPFLFLPFSITLSAFQVLQEARGPLREHTSGPAGVCGQHLLKADAGPAG